MIGSRVASPDMVALVTVMAAMATCGSGCVRMTLYESGDGPRSPRGDARGGEARYPGADARVSASDGAAGVADNGARDAEAVDSGAQDKGLVLDAGPVDAGIDQAARDGGPMPGTWVTIPAGTFMMGSPADEACRQTDEDLHQVTLTRPFEIQQTEVTQAQFEAVMGYNRFRHTACGGECPAEVVSWHEAAAYCNALSDRDRYSRCYSCNGSRSNVSCVDAAAYSGATIYSCPGYRLPTDAEWEYAYRAGANTAYYSGPNSAAACTDCATADANAELIAWYARNAIVSYAPCFTTACGCTGPHRVKTKQANAWGIYDMGGNMAEWCHDVYQASLGSSPATDPWGAAPGRDKPRVIRGGTFHGGADRLRAANRASGSPGSGFADVGFRCVRSLLP